MTMTIEADRYWQQYLTSPTKEVERPPAYVESFSFGFTARDASEIAGLVLDGTKTATGSVLWSYEADGKTIPRVGDHWIVVDGGCTPVCIIRTTDVSIIPFDEIPDVYAREGGEADRTLATWRPMYWRYRVRAPRSRARPENPLGHGTLHRRVSRSAS